MRAISLFAALTLAIGAFGAEPKCGVKNRHLLIDAESAEGGTWSLVLNDYATLARNGSLTWDIDSDSFSTVEMKDKFGFSWVPGADKGTGKGKCQIQTTRTEISLDVEISCKDLSARDGAVPGFVNPRVAQISCAL